MSSPYRTLLRRGGARRLALACAVAWLSYSGYVLAIVLAVHRATGSFAAAGLAVAAEFAGSGALAPLRGRLVDRRGARALRALAGGHVAGAALLIAGCLHGGSPGPVLGGAALLGACAPPLIGTARAAWTQLADPGLARAAHALNGALADVAQIGSPALVAALALLVSPVAALAALVAGAALAAWLIPDVGRDSPLDRAEADRPEAAGAETAEAAATAAGAAADPEADGREDGRATGARSALGVLRDSPGLRTLVAGDLAIGGVGGGLEVAVTAAAAAHGVAAAGAVPLAASALGAFALSVWVGSGRTSRSAAQRYLGGCVIVATTLPFVLLAASVVALAAVLVAVGAGVGLLGVALFELLDDVAPADRQTEAFTWLTTSNAAGSAIGAAGAGRLARAGVAAPLALVIGFAVLAAGLAYARRDTLRR